MRLELIAIVVIIKDAWKIIKKVWVYFIDKFFF